ncbi:MAG: hypothetical protein KME16_02725 [Scytolyngbya sp. HA4215-MV1]|nr:hypothetical protein [Scytolyngbya sp. HA4215-MV1]
MPLAHPNVFTFICNHLLTAVFIGMSHTQIHRLIYLSAHPFNSGLLVRKLL